jgi:zinc transporter ZupT
MITGVFRKLRETVRGNDGRAKAQGYLQPIDTDQIAKELDLVRLARERGSQELPPSDALTPDAVEQQITEGLEGEWTWHGGELINNLRAYAARLIAVSVQTELANLTLKAQNALTKLRDANHRAEAELGPLRETFVGYRDELSDFQKDHRLKRAARNPARRWTTLGLLVMLIGFESVLNGFFFAKGAEFGLLGGIGTAMGISLVNVISSFAVGLFPMRWVNNRNYIIKLAGLVGSIGGVAALVMLHGFAAHYRDATAVVGEDLAFQRALETLRATPFGLSDLNSFYLFGLGIVLALTAVWKGYTFDDPYPRYGATYRRAADARESYSEEHAFLFDDLEQIKEQTVAELDAGIRRIPLFPQQAAQVRAQRDAHLQSFTAYEANLEAAGNRLLALYRDANRASRRTPPPKHFDTRWRLPRSFLKDATVLTETSEPPTRPLDANAALDQLRQLGKEVLDEYEALLVKYPHPTKMQ